MLRRLTLAVLVMLGPLAAQAAPLDTLIEERAREVYADALPPESRFEITLKTAPPPDTALLSEFWMDLNTGQFLTNAVSRSGDVQRLSGFALVTLPVPVPSRRLMPGEIVSEADLDTVDLPMGRVGTYAVTDGAALVGMEVRRLLAPGRPVQSQSVQEPRVIERGDRVEIRFTDGALSLVAPGRALTDAHRGEDVRIVNLVSNKSVTGMAVERGIVEIVR